jgi:hypothetical protein
MTHGIIVALVFIGLLISAMAIRFFYTGNEYASFRHLDQQTAKSRLVEMIQRDGPQAAWNFLKQLFLLPDNSFTQDASSSEADVHMLAHVVGASLYARFGANGILSCDDSFTYGCYHGFVAAMIEQKGMSALSSINSICENSAGLGTCIHGAGHGIYELEAGDLAKALNACSLFTSDIDDCAEGVFMQSNWHTPDKSHAADEWYPCDVIPSKYRADCASTRPGYLFRTKNETMLQVGAFCKGAETKALADRCYTALGSEVARRARGDGGPIMQECSLLDAQGQQHCLTGAIELVAAARYKDWESALHALCDNTALQKLPQCSL